MSNNLCDAAYQGDVATVRTILAEKKIDPYVAGSDGNYPFMCALSLKTGHCSIEYKKSKEDCFNLLRPEFEDLNRYCDKSGDTMAHYLAKHRYESALQYLRRQADINNDYSIFFSTNLFGQKPIHFAIMQKQDAIVAALLKIPGMKTVADWNNRNLIHHMAQYGTAAMLNSYCNSLSNTQLAQYINMIDIDGTTPYLLARDSNGSNERADIMDILVAHGAVPVRSMSPLG